MDVCMRPAFATRPRSRTPLVPVEGKRHNGAMKKVQITELRNHLSRYLDEVRAGGRIIVLDREKPVAEIVPIAPAGQDGGLEDARLAALEREGIVLRGTGRISPDLLRPTSLGKGANVLEALLEERESGR
jgi:prevent-host-death family protein